MARKLSDRRYGSLTLSAVLVALVAGLLVLAQPSRAQQSGEVPDADCPGPIETGVQVQTPIGTIASTFKAENSGTLTSAQVVVQKGSTDSGNYVLEIRPVDDAGAPTDVVLASTTVDDAIADPNAFTQVTATFDPAATVEEGEQYALVVGRPGADEIQLGARFMGGDPCPDSRLFASNTRTTPYGEFTTADLVFATFVTVLTANDDSYTAAKKTLKVPASEGVLENDIDPDGEGLTASLVTGPSKGKLTLNEEDGSFSYKKPKKGFNKGTTFVYEASDGKGGTDQATVTIKAK